MTALIVLGVITAYLAGVVAAAPKLMRLIYQDKLTLVAQANARHEKHMEEWRKRKDSSAFNMPLRYNSDSELNAMREARYEGAWWALVWPVSLTYHRVAGTAFAQEIAAQQSAANTKIIKDYERLLHESFEKELATPSLRKSIFGGRPPKGGTGVSSPRRN